MRTSFFYLFSPKMRGVKFSWGSVAIVLTIITILPGLSFNSFAENEVPPLSDVQAEMFETNSLRLQWWSYFKNEFSYWDRSDLAEKWGDFNKLRFHLTGQDLDELYSFQVEVDLFSFHGNTKIFYADRKAVNLDRAFLTLNLEHLNIRIGKQQIKLGPGKIWSPTDIFNPFDLTVFHDEERDGESAFVVNYSWTSWLKTAFIFTPAYEVDFFRRAIVLRSEIENQALSLSYLEYTEEDSRREHRLTSFALDGKATACEYWFETAYVIRDDHDNQEQTRFVKVCLGADLIIRRSFYLICEMFYDGGGKGKARDYTDQDWQDYLAGKLVNLGKSYLYTGTQFYTTPKLALSLGWIRNCSDQSSYYYFYGFYKLFEYTELTMGMDLTAGEGDSEFALFGNSYNLSLKVQI